MALSPGQKYARRQKKRRDLVRTVLAHLMRHGASLYDALSIQFDAHHTAELQPLLRTLKEYGYIDVTPNKMVTITTFGLQELKSKDQM